MRAVGIIIIETYAFYIHSLKETLFSQHFLLQIIDSAFYFQGKN